MRKLLFSLLFALVLVISHPYCAAAEVVVDRVVALVNNDPITLSDVLKEAEDETMEIIKKFKGSDREREIETLHKAILQDLVDKKLQLQEAARLGIEVSDHEVVDAVEDLKTQMGLDDSGLRQMIFSQKMTPEEFRAQLREFLTIVKLVEQEVNARVVLTQEEKESYYQEHKSEFQQEAGVKVQQIFMFLDVLKGSDEVAQVMAKMAEIKLRLLGGERFESLAAKFSQDPSAAHGGDMGVFKKGQLMPLLDKIVFELKEGEVSEPIWTESGVHMLRVVERLSTREKTLGEVESLIEQRLRDRRLEEGFRKFIATLRSKAYVEMRM